MAEGSFRVRTVTACVVLIVCLAIVGFLYRNSTERETSDLVAASTTSGQACTAEAKVCPDGSAVSRTGPSCSFAACPLPNVELSTASSTIEFVLPAGYVKHEQGSSDQGTLAVYEKSTGSSDTDHTLAVSSYEIPAGETPNTILLAHTLYDPSGQQATTTSTFKTLVAGKNTFYAVDSGRHEGQVETLYYLITDTTVYRFDLIEREVTNGTDSNLNISALPEHRSLVQALSTVQVRN